MIYRYTYHGGVWVDLEHPTEDEVRRVAEEFSISERLETELFSPTPNPLVASDAGVTFLVLHFPSHGAVDGEIHDQEIDFVIGESFIISVRYEVVEPLRRLQKILETQQLISPQEGITTDVLLEILFTHMYTSVRDHVNNTANRLTHIEKVMFSGLAHTTVHSISEVSREFLHLEASLANQEEPLTRFLRAITKRGSFGASFVERSERILAERIQIVRLVMTYRAVAIELRETNSSLIETRQNEIMKTLTVITFTVMPLELITFIFSMHAMGTPLESNPNAFWIILAAMLVTGVIMGIFLIRKRWL